MTRHTIVSIDAIWDKIHEARQNGYAFAEQEWVVGEIVLAVAVTDARQRPLAAIHVAGSMADWDGGRFRDKLSPLVIEAAQAISA